MTSPRTPAIATEARVTAYLDDLARMLTDLDPATRDDVLAGVREHLDATLAEHPGDPGAVDAALLRLGRPERVAAEARADLPPSDPYVRPGRPPAVRHRVRARVAGMAALALVAVPTVAALVARLATEVGTGSADVGMFLGPHPSEVLVLLPLTFPLWVVAVVVALLGPDLGGRTKTWLVLLGPATALAVLVTALLADPRSIGTPVSLVVLAATAVGIAGTGRRVRRETRP